MDHPTYGPSDAPVVAAFPGTPVSHTIAAELPTAAWLRSGRCSQTTHVPPFAPVAFRGKCRGCVARPRRRDVSVWPRSGCRARSGGWPRTGRAL